MYIEEVLVRSVCQIIDMTHIRFAIIARIPAEALRACAFFRVWCLVELCSALEGRKPVVMMVGNADAASGAFTPNKAMLSKLYRIVDIKGAAASVEADRKRILGNIEATLGFSQVG